MSTQVADETIDVALERLQNECQEQRVRISKIRGAVQERSMSQTSMSLQQTNLSFLGDVNFHVKCKRRWNQELQQICQDSNLDCFSKRDKANDFLREFQVDAEEKAKEFIDKYLSDVPSDSDEIEWASQEDRENGSCLCITLHENYKYVMKETQRQALFLSQQLMVLSHRPIVHVFPRVMVWYHGRSLSVSSELPNVLEASVNIQKIPEFRHAMEVVCDSLNLCGYRRLLDDGSETDWVGPVDASVRYCADGRYYIETLNELTPHFPPAPGISLTESHTMFLRPGVVQQNSSSLSPGAFVTFGTTDSALQALQVKQCAGKLCKTTIPNFANDLPRRHVNTGKELALTLHEDGINIGLLAVVLCHLPAAETLNKKLKKLIVTEMVARSARDIIREKMLSRVDIDEVTQVIGEFCAEFCAEDRNHATWQDELNPVLKRKFAGFGSLTEVYDKDVDKAMLLSRLSELMDFKFAEGVSEKGSSPFHFTIAHMGTGAKHFPLPQFFLLHMRYKSFGGLSPKLGSTPQNTLKSAQAALYSRLAVDRNPDISNSAKDYLRIRHDHHGAASFAYGFALYEIGAVWLKEKQLKEGISFLEQSTEILAKFGANFVLGWVYALKGNALAELGVFGDAVKDMNQATSIFSQGRFGQSSYQKTPRTPLLAATATPTQFTSRVKSIYAAETMEKLASLYDTKGLLEEAEPLYREILAIATHLGGDVDTVVSNALNNLAVNLFSQERYSEAETLYREDLRISELLYGGESTEVATSLNNLAAVCDVLNRSAEAEPLYRRDLDITMRTKGETHDDVGTSRNNLATCLRKLGKLDEAHQQFEKAMEIRIHHHGDTHVSIAEIITNIGAMKLAKGDAMGAKQSFIDALNMYDQCVGKFHHKCKRCLEHLENLCEALGQQEEAERYSDRLMDLKRAESDIYTAQQEATKQRK